MKKEQLRAVLSPDMEVPAAFGVGGTVRMADHSICGPFAGKVVTVVKLVMKPNPGLFATIHHPDVSARANECLAPVRACYLQNTRGEQPTSADLASIEAFRAFLTRA